MVKERSSLLALFRIVFLLKVAEGTKVVEKMIVVIHYVKTIEKKPGFLFHIFLW